MKKILCSILSAASFLYYLWLGSRNGFGMSVLPFWLLLSILLLLLGFWKDLPLTGRIPRPFRTAGKLCLTAGLLLFLAVEGLVLWGMTLEAPSSPELDYLIVLGAGVNDGRPSHTLELRLIQALDYLDAHPGTRVVVSGGQGSSESISEAESMYNWLLEKGLNASRILMEDRSTTTAENMQYSLPLILADNDSGELSIGIVTSNFHIFRSLCLADHVLDEQADGGQARDELADNEQARDELADNEQARDELADNEQARNVRAQYHLYGLPSDFPAGALPHYMVREFFTICVDTILGNMN